MKKNSQDKARQKDRKPFFARLLEAQDLEQVAGGASPHTKKYPSDQEECTTTEKYPSDEVIVTLKHPSDKEDGY